jgi:hypothetical protein
MIPAPFRQQFTCYNTTKAGDETRNIYCSVLPNGWAGPVCSATGTMMSA